MDKHPKFRGNLWKLFKEGFKKAVIFTVYSLVPSFLYHHAKINLKSGSMTIAVFCIILFMLTYLFLIGGLLNRYLYRGKFSKAFNLIEIVTLISIFDMKSFLQVVIAVIISQTFAVSIILGFSEGFTMIELIYSLSTFFLTPFLFIASKRLVGLSVRQLLENSHHDFSYRH